MSEDQCANGHLTFLSRQLADKNLIINAISDALMVLDPKTYQILDVNQSFLKTYGLSGEEVLGTKCFETTHHLDAPCWTFGSHRCPLEEILKTGKGIQMAHEHLNHGGKTLSFGINAYPIKDENGEVTRIIHLARDETERRRAEEEIRRSSEKIRMFAYSIAHDLKGPAIGIHGVTNLLQKHYGHALDERGRKYCDTILNAAEQISTFVKQINEYISTKEVPLSFERISLKEVFRAVEEEFSKQLRDRQIKWREPERVPEVKADKLSVLRAIRNLVDNALKYGGEKLRHIEIGYEVSDDSHIISVKDDGIGLREKEQEGLFAAFVRKENSRGIPGAGIGLAIVKEIAERHRGKVWVASHHGEGTIFHISFSKNLGAP